MKKNKIGMINLKFTPNQITVLLFMTDKKDYAFTTHELAEKTKMSWRTTRAALNGLLQKSVVQKRIAKDGKIARWTLA